MSLFKKTSISLGLALAGVVMSPAANAGFVYGPDNNNAIWEVDILLKTSKAVYPAGIYINQDNLPANQGKNAVSNAFAFDTDLGQLYFLAGETKVINGVVQPVYDTENNRLYMWDRVNPPVRVAATPEQLGFDAADKMPQNAAYYAGGFWYFHDFSPILHKVTFTGQASGQPAFATLETWEITGGMPLTNNFGDIAIDFNTGILYAATGKQGCGACTASFYSINLNQLTPGVAGNPGTGTATMIKSGVDLRPNQTLTSAQRIQLANDSVMQIAFDENFIDLWGHQSSKADGTNWGIVDVATGNLGSVNGFSTLMPGTTYGLRDLGGTASAPSNDPVPVKPPRAIDDQYITLIDTPISSTVATNDTNPYPGTCAPFSLTTSDDPLIVNVGTTTQGGSVTALDPCTGKFTYTPPLGFTGTDTFTYKICLAEPMFTAAGEVDPPVAQCDDAVVTITIEGQCKFSTLTQGGWSNKAHDRLLGGLMAEAGTVHIGAINKIYTFTNKDAVQNFLPSSGTPRVLDMTRVDPPKNKDTRNTFAGQLLTMTLNVLANPEMNWAQFKTSQLSAATRTYFEANNIRNVNDLIARANLVIGGVDIKKDEISFLTGVLEQVTMSWHEGVESSSSVLNCPSK